MNTHLATSHPADSFDFPVQVTLEDYQALFMVARVTKEEEIAGIQQVLRNRAYWVAIRNHPVLQNVLVSGLGIGEFKLFLKSERN
jgi:hypothetical protein